MSLILGIDTSSTDLGVGLHADGMPAAAYSRFLRNSHAETIAEAVAMVLRNNGAAANDVTHVAVSAGPGSFTGLRIGIAFVKGFCHGAGVLVMPVSSLFILAHGGRSAKPSASIVAAIDARRDEVFWARFASGGTSLSRETPDVLSPVHEFKDSLRDGDIVVTDTMGYGRSTVFDFLSGRPEVFPVENFPIQRGLWCAAAGAEALGDAASWHDADEVLPRYLRAFAPPPKAAAA